MLIPYAVGLGLSAGAPAGGGEDGDAEDAAAQLVQDVLVRRGWGGLGGEGGKELWEERARMLARAGRRDDVFVLYEFMSCNVEV